MIKWPPCKLAAGSENGYVFCASVIETNGEKSQPTFVLAMQNFLHRKYPLLDAYLNGESPISISYKMAEILEVLRVQGERDPTIV